VIRRSALAGSILLSTLVCAPARAQDADIVAESPALVAQGGVLYVANGPLHQFEVTAHGPVLRRSIATGHDMRNVVGVPVGDAAHAGLLWAADGESVSVYDTDRLELPRLRSTKNWPDVGGGFLPIEGIWALEDRAVVGLREPSLSLYLYYFSDVDNPAAFEHGHAEGLRSPITNLVAVGEEVLAARAAIPLGGTSSGELGYLGDPPGRWLQWVGFPAQDLVVSGERAYVGLPGGTPPGGQPIPASTVVVSLSEAAPTMLGQIESVPMAAAHDGFGLGLEGDQLVVSSLANPDLPVVLHTASLAGTGMDVRAVDGVHAGLGPGTWAAVLSRNAEGLWLELFAISTGSPPARVRGAVQVSSLPADISLDHRIFLPRASVGAPSASSFTAR
jgi:hypothetical protein